MLHLVAEIQPEPGSPEMADGWRGIADFGEVWSPADADLLWPPESELPAGEPVLYGCEVRFLSREKPVRVLLRFWSIHSPRAVMGPGAEFTLRDGPSPRATGRILGGVIEEHSRIAWHHRTSSSDRCGRVPSRWRATLRSPSQSVDS